MFARLPMSRLPMRRMALPAGLVMVPLLISACAAPSGTAPAAAQSFEQSTELVISCQHDAALAALDSADAARGGSTSASGLQRVIVLRDAGRTIDAARVLRERNARDDVSAQEAVHSGTAVENGLEAIRAERAARTGSRSCR